MGKATHFIPQGLPAIIPQIIVKDAKVLIEFAQRAFDAKLSHTMPGPDGKGIMHGMLLIAGVPIFIADANEFAPITSGCLFVYFPDVDTVFKNAIAAGATVMAPVSDMFWGDRWGMIRDPFGNVWQLATHTEDISPEEMQTRMKALPK